jgi:dipeptidyl aminopeptidase/acylaminoacyl peptidase
MDFLDLEAFQDVPRLAGLALSPDGTRLVTSVATLDPTKTRWVNALWEVDPTGTRAARRLTRSANGEGAPAFTADGDLLFVSGRPDVEATEDDEKPKLWLLPAAGGEAQAIGSRPGGVSGPRTAQGVVVVVSDTLPASATEEQDAATRKERKDKKINAILHTGYPVRYWDHDLGPGAPRLLVGSLSEDPVQWRDLTPAPGRSLDEAAYALSPEGTQVVTTWSVAEPRGSRRSVLVVVDVATGDRRVLADGLEEEWSSPKVSPNGLTVVAIRNTRSTASDPGDNHVVILGIDDGTQRVVKGWDRWPTQVEWAGDALLVVADEGGRAPVFRVELEDLSVTRLTTGDGAFTDLCVAADGRAAYALRTGYDGAATPVRIDPRVPGEPERLLSPVPALDLPGTLTEVTTTVADGREVRAWLALPEGDGPHPLVLWVHGGPLSSWSTWSWRWCPWLLVAQGYAVLLPDPALSTGYGIDQIKAGWGNWGQPTYDDLMAITDVALERPDLDASRTAVMGGSFGGYMANWIAGHTDRFRAIVTHASLWDLERFGPTTDASWYWAREMTPEMVAANNPAAFADAIVTPMLVIHGDKDYRVPIGEALSLWWDLCSRAEDPETMEHRFLYFPDENHWVLTPQHAAHWYEVVLSFLGKLV